MKINNNKYKFRINIAWQVEQVSDVVYIKEFKNDIFYYFKDVSKKIWMFIKEGKNIQEIKNILSEKYNVDYEIINKDVDEFINDLEMKELIEKVEE